MVQLTKKKRLSSNKHTRNRRRQLGGSDQSNNIDSEVTPDAKMRCPRGERRNPITNECEPIPTKIATKTVLGCSVDYTPANDTEQLRFQELTKMSGQKLRDILSRLKGEPTGQKHSSDARRKGDLVNLILCIENMKDNKPEPAEEPIEEPAEEPLDEPLDEPLEEPLEEPTEEPLEEPLEEPIEEPLEELEKSIQPNESIYEIDDIVNKATIPDNTNFDINMTDDDKIIQNSIGVIPDNIDSKEGNAFLFNKELVEQNTSPVDNQLDFLYPELNDPNFNIKIAKRKEFNDTMYDGKIRDIKAHSEMLCNADFELMPHQMFVKNFLSFQTPYNALLLYHGLGTGKTCSAIGIAEEMRGFMKQIGLTQRILVIASPNVQNNFRLQLFDERKLEADGELWNLNTCIGNALIKEINPTSMRGIPREKVIIQINSIIKKYYSFVGYTEIAHFIQRKVLPVSNNEYTTAQRKELKIRQIRKFFDNRLIIIDEVHNIRPTDDNKDKTKTASLLMEVCKYAENIRLLMLSATPMYNSYKEIIWLTNILNSVDKRSIITESMVFDSNGNFVEEKNNNGKITENGKDLLKRKLTGYVSYVRGENPYTFPYRIYPDIFSPENLVDTNNYPKLQMNKKEIDEPLKHIPLYMNNLGEYQTHGYKYIMDYLHSRNVEVTDKFGKTKIMPTFENMETFGYTYLEKPLQSLDIVYPSMELDILIQNSNIKDINMENIVKNMVGKNGLAKVTKHKTTDLMHYDYEYNENILKNHGRIFHKDNLHKYSNKLSTICNTIAKSTGIVIVYSQYIDGGVVPMALALEEMGLSRFGSAKYTRSLFKKPPSEYIDSITMKPKSEFIANNDNKFKPARYVMITGDKRYSPNNYEDMKYITNPENANGENVKVILITKAAAEGLDFKNIRQIHIMEPWYNMNRIEQIIGRGVRNLSHCRLPFEDRNVELYLHATQPQGEEETADMYVYRFAEKKAKHIGIITRLLKEISVDCVLNIGQTNFTIDKLLENTENKNIQIKLASNQDDTLIEYKVGDRIFTDMCDYMDNCSFTCSPTADIEPSDIIIDTYNEEHTRINYSAIVKRIRNLFKEKIFYRRTELINSINIKVNDPNKNQIKNISSQIPNENIDYSYDEKHIDFALSRFINNKNEQLTDKYGRIGYLTNRGDIYAFQPIEITDQYASIFERDTPIDYKPINLQLELPVKQQGKAKTSSQISNDVDNLQSVRTYTDVLQGIKNNMNSAIVMKDDYDPLHISTYIQSLESGEVDWYKHLNNVFHKFKLFHQVSDDNIIRYAIHHAIDTLSNADKLILIQYLYDDSRDTLLYIESIIKDYFNTKLIRSGSLQGIIITSDTNDKATFNIYVQSEVESREWIELDPTEYRDFKDDLGKFISKHDTYNNIIGFMSIFKNNNTVFKTKNIRDKRNNKGAYCENAGKRDIINRLNQIHNQDIYSEKSINNNISINGVSIENKVYKNGLCVMMELLLRHYDYTKKENKRWFFNPEEAILNRILEMNK